MKKVLFSILIAFMVSTMAGAQNFRVDGIEYFITSSSGGHTVLVAKGPCSESAKIPAHVTDEDGVTYRVEASVTEYSGNARTLQV